MSFGLAVHATVNPVSQFDRKSYFYPDCPFNYQITQFYHPLLTGGEISTRVDGELKKFAINRAHLENDAGKLIHFTEFAGVDFNRSGAPLLEIVSEPCMRSPKEAAAYAMAIKAIMEYIDSSECNMQEGHFRMDANISVRKKGEEGLRNKTEIKNMNSFFNMQLAIEAEIIRQIEHYLAHPHTPIESGTYRYDLEKNRTILMRRKESADDYRYFPEPDLPPLVVSSELIASLKSELPELPKEREERYIYELHLSPYSAALLINDKKLCDEFEEGLRICKNPVTLCNWLTVEFMGRAKEAGKSLAELGITMNKIAELVNLIDQGVITGKIAKSVADLMIVQKDLSPLQIVEGNPDFKPLRDDKLIEEIVDQVLRENPASIADYKNGKDKAFQFLVGQVMKGTKGKAQPELVRDLLLKKIS